MPQLLRAERSRSGAWGGGIVETSGPDHTGPWQGLRFPFNQPYMLQTVDDGLGGRIDGLAGTQAISLFKATARASWLFSLTGR